MSQQQGARSAGQAACRRTIELLSLSLDGQLEPLFEAMLSAHLRSCAICDARAREVATMTNLLRSSEREDPLPAAVALDPAPAFASTSAPSEL
ncbi:MAG: zf-HC2 domain-containing protein [Gaiellaceae bacterium]